METVVQSELLFIHREWTPRAEYNHLAVLGPKDVHVWQRPFEGLLTDLEHLHPLLSEDESVRAARFRFDQHRNEFIFCRGTLRMLLGTYLDQPPEQLLFSYSAEGKPDLAPDSSSPHLSFNVSHTDGMALFAFTWDRKIGVDVEKVRKDFASEEIAERFFSLAERQALRELPESEKQQAFFRGWTRKEAFVKAKGGGLSHSLQEFDVSVAPNDNFALKATRPDSNEAKSWIVRSLPVASGYAAAIAVESESR